MDCSSFSSSSVRVRFLWATEVELELMSRCAKVLGRDMVTIGLLRRVVETICFAIEAVPGSGHFQT